MNRHDQHGSGRTAHRPWRTRLLAAAGAGALLLASGAVAPSVAAKEGDGGDGGDKVLTVAVAQSVDSLSPFLAVRLLSTSIHRLTYEYLTNYDAKDNHVIPGLATEWKSSPDKLTWTYTIRSDSKWSDGEQATAEDAAWTFNTMMTDPGAATANGSFVGNFAEVTAPSPTQLVIRLKKPQATMTALDVPIVPKHVWEKVDDFSKFNNDKDFPVVGNGPFVLTDYKPDSYVRLKANKDFWRGAPKFDELVFRYYKDQDAAVAALRKGEVSFVAGSPSLTPAQADSLKGEENIRVNDAPGRRFYALATNPGARAKDGTRFGDGDPSLLDQRVRNALFMAVDRKAIVDKVFQGHAVEGAGYIPPRFSSYFFEPSGEQELAYDPAKAAQLLDEAGYRTDSDGKRLGKDGKPLDYRILCHATDPNDKAVGKYLQEWWGELGISVTLNCLDNVTDPWLAGKYDLAFDGWSVNPDPDFVLSIHTCAALPATPKDTGATDNFICDKKYDDLYARQLGEYDAGKRAAIVKQMQSRLYDTGYMNVMAYPNAVEAYRTDQIESITTMPSAAGNIYGQDGYWSWWSAVPADSGDSSGGSSSTGTVIGIAAGVVVLVGLGVLFAVRRRASADDRE
ncbi:ABC transporter substrate-binding protein [Streptomyces violaceoruber]|uniref:Peptide transport system secreted peptide binding protein n=4 Tax=Streptomyces TaxID=1883 RepID=O86636_STRCO|nr:MULTISPECIES: ABC transporter substrate-binding protein [Streptomyces]MBQ0953466.1 ABC transporter substrate-binding protein [Streptomyces sp. RK76]MDX2929720.1 ABC transporter substrate-binding protein [Streptomyces sp. NRRL_B-16638]MDX3349331.1 ABC transporter substrate-binding protein [Streptomyces sp. ME02-6979A]MDX3371306.1 ABC transporter substrate-binding protein [Streptomyces sp. ME02-6987-2C]MDX3402002.1 ABC transporter substrate-binding protein [Streptomyces sp. ME01-18h]